MNFWVGALAAMTLIYWCILYSVDVQTRYFGAIHNPHVAEMKDIKLPRICDFGDFWRLLFWAWGLYPQAFIEVVHQAANDLIAHVAQSKI